MGGNGSAERPSRAASQVASSTRISIGPATVHRRLAKLAPCPITVKFRRSSEPINPASISPVATPTPTLISRPDIMFSTLRSAIIARAHATARSGAVGSLPVAPKTAIIMSPTNLSTNPSCSCTTRVMAVMCSLSINTDSSGDMCWVISVYFRMSQNNTVIPCVSPPKATSPLIIRSATYLSVTLFKTSRYLSFNDNSSAVSLNAAANLPNSSLLRTGMRTS